MGRFEEDKALRCDVPRTVPKMMPGKVEQELGEKQVYQA